MKTSCRKTIALVALFVAWGSGTVLAENNPLPGKATLEAWKYDNSSQSWKPVNSEGAPSVGRTGVLWADGTPFKDRAYYFGSYAAEQPPTGECVPTQYTTTGGYYDLTADRWVPLSTENLPEGRKNALISRVGNKVVMWGGLAAKGCKEEPVSSGSVLDLETNTWTPINTRGAPLVGRFDGAWTEKGFLLWGRTSARTVESSGGIFNPQDHSWTPINSQGGPSLENALVEWTGKKLVVWGSEKQGSLQSTGAVYDVESNTWTPMPALLTPVPAYVTVKAHLGSDVFYWGASSELGCLSSGAIYSIESNSWRQVSSLGAPHNCQGPLTFWDAGTLVVWGGKAPSFDKDHPEAFHWTNEGGVYSLQKNAWEKMDTKGAPTIDGEKNRELGYRTMWFQRQMVIWKNVKTDTGWRCEGASYSPDRNVWTPLAQPKPDVPFESVPGRMYNLDRLTPDTSPVVFGFAVEANTDGSVTAYCTNLLAPKVKGNSNGEKLVWTGKDLVLFIAEPLD